MIWQARLAYRRRWGRLAWHIAALAREPMLPELEEATGEAPAGGRGQSEEQMIHAVRLWKAVLEGKRDPG